MSDLENIKAWCMLDVLSQDNLIDHAISSLGKAYSHIDTCCYSSNHRLRIAVLMHKPSGIEFNLVVGGDFIMGLSETEEDIITGLSIDAEDFVANMKPTRQIRVKPFLMSRFPLLNEFIQRQKAFNSSRLRPSACDDESDIGTAYLTRDEAISLANRYGFELPSEAQWEYSCRAMTKTPFYFGNSLPDEDELDRGGMRTCFTDSELTESAINSFGLISMHAGSWCSDSYRDCYLHLPSTDIPIEGSAPYSVRGGAACVWPWQDTDEWIMALSAFRTNSEDIDAAFDGHFPARFVKRL